MQANPSQLPRNLQWLCLSMLVLGLISFAVGLLTNPETTWRAYHVNYLYFAGIAQGGLAFACALVIIGAKWAGPVRHVAEGLAAWAPITFVLCAIGFFGREHIYTEWIHGVPHGKSGWLNMTRLYAMDLGILGVLALLSLRYLKISFRPSMKGAGDRAPAMKAQFEAWTANWQGDEAEREESTRKLTSLAPKIALLYAFGYGFIGFDQVMSLSPMWFSNLFAWYFAWGGFLCSITATTLICILLRRNSTAWASQITKDRLHDLGKLIFAFSIFWMYLFFSQYIVIWYGNLPEETQFFQARLGSQFLQDTWHWSTERLDEPYVKLALTAWLGCWVIPFWVLLGQAAKKTPAVLGSVAVASLFGFWLERNALIWPALAPNDGSAWIGGIQIGMALGFLGGFVLVYLMFSRVFPSLPLPSSDR